MGLKEIDKRIDELDDLLHKKETEWWKDPDVRSRETKKDPHQDWLNYLEFRKPESTELQGLEKQRKLLVDPEYDDIPDYGDQMSLSDFIECVESGGFIDYDGFGHYVKDGKEVCNIDLVPSDVKAGTIRKEFDSIVWFNR